MRILIGKPPGQFRHKNFVRLFRRTCSQKPSLRLHAQNRLHDLFLHHMIPAGQFYRKRHVGMIFRGIRLRRKPARLIETVQTLIAGKGGKQKGHIAVLPEQNIIGEQASPPPPQRKKGCRCLFRVFHYPGQNQFFLRPRHGHIENAKLLRQTVPFQFQRNGAFSQVFAFHPPLGIHIVHTDPGIHVHRQNTASLLFAETCRQSRHKADGKLQPLALMDAHNPDYIRVLILHGGLAVIHLIFFQLLHIAKKVIEPEITRLLVVCRLHQKHLHIGAPPAPLGSGRHIMRIPGIPQNDLQKLVYGEIH